MEIVARTLDAKYQIIDKFLGDNKKYSVLLEELSKRIPADSVFLESASLGTSDANTLNIAGKGADYIAIARFIDSLSDTEFEGAAPRLKELFTDVTLNSVNLDSQDGDVSYFITITFDSSLLN